MKTLLILFLASALMLSMAPHSLYAANTSVLRAGSRGTEVTRLQKSLNTLGYKLPVTGLFGDQTEQAVMKFQAASRLKPDGIAGPQTLKLIEDRVVAKQKPAAPPKKPVAIVDGVYIVQKGDTLRSIAQTLKVSVGDLASINRMTENHALYIGQALTIPTGSVSSAPKPVSGDSPVVSALPLGQNGAGDSRIILTFDQAREGRYFGEVLKILSERGARATFFVGDSLIASSANGIKGALESGNTIENQGRPIADGATLEKVVQDIREVSLLIQQITGKFPSFYRPASIPSIDASQVSAMSQQRLVMWTNLGSPDDDEFLSHTKAAIKNGAILRFSLDDAAVVRILPEVLEYAESLGYSVVGLVDR